MKKKSTLFVLLLTVLWISISWAADEAVIQELQTDVITTKSKTDQNSVEIQNLKGGLPAEQAARKAADANLQMHIDNIQLTPGPQGAQGPIGPAGLTGPAGPQGPAGIPGSMNVVDANGTVLGTLVGYELTEQNNLGNATFPNFTTTLHWMDANERIWRARMSPVTTASLLSQLPLGGYVVFSQPNCTGQSYAVPAPTHVLNDQIVLAALSLCTDGCPPEPDFAGAFVITGPPVFELIISSYWGSAGACVTPGGSGTFEGVWFAPIEPVSLPSYEAPLRIRRP